MSYRPEVQEVLEATDTPTVCNAIEYAQGKRGFDAFTKEPIGVSVMGPSTQEQKSTVIAGFAMTAKIRAQKPPRDPPETVRERRMAYYRMVARASSPVSLPAALAIEDADWPHCVGAFWGEINSHIHQAFGLRGVFTNGLVRDLDALAPDFQILAGGLGPSHAFVHVTELDTPVCLFGLTIRPGDYLHADRHGAVIVPPELLPRMDVHIEALQRSEALILDALRDHSRGHSRGHRQTQASTQASTRMTFEDFEKYWRAFEKARI